MKKCILIILAFLLVCCKENTTKLTYPQIEKQVAIDTYHGQQIEDPYRNLEDLKDSVVDQWNKNQNTYADTILKNIPNRDSLLQQMLDYDGRLFYKIGSYRYTNNDRYFYLKRHIDEKTYRLYYRKSFEAKEELLYDPKDFKPTSGNPYDINFIKPSRNGSYVVIAMS